MHVVLVLEHVVLVLEHVVLVLEHVVLVLDSPDTLLAPFLGGPHLLERAHTCLLGGWRETVGVNYIILILFLGTS